MLSLALATSMNLIAATSFETTVAPFVEKHCAACHNAQAKAGGLNLKQASLDDGDLWRNAVRRLEAGEMPPPGAPRPDPGEVHQVTAWLKTELARAEDAKPIDPGRVTARRLNRYEYNASIRDLLGVDLQPADNFPADDFGYGFDNIGDVLSLTPALMEKYLSAAKKIASAAIDVPPTPKTPIVDHHKNLAEDWPFTWTRRFSWEGDYEIRFAVPYFVDHRHDPGAIFVSVDGAAPRSFALATEYANEGRYQDVKVHLTAGVHRLQGWAERDAAALTLEELKKDADRVERAKRFLQAAQAGDKETADGILAGPGRAGRGPLAADVLEKRRADLLAAPLSPSDVRAKLASNRQPYIESIEVRGPANPLPAARPESYKKVFTCGHAPGHHTEACIRNDLANLARRAWRRPVTAAEAAKLLSFVKLAEQQSEPLDEAAKVGVTAILVSPNFLFRTERAATPGVSRKLSGVEMASRLSYFLWSSIPDDELLSLAEADKLHDSSILEAQVKRMLHDPKTGALVDNFGAQWLLVRNLDNITPDPDKYPQFNGAIRAAMKEETRLFFTDIVREDRSISDFLTAKYTWLNEPLARLYGIPGITGNEFRKVDLHGTPRMGILTQGSVLTVSSYATRTSPVLRGKWVLENLLNAPPPPPPANVPALEASASAGGTLREQMERHRSNPVCASCHAKMDPLGFGLENFDGIGRWRTMDGKFPIDSTGTLPGGGAFSTPEELIGLLASDKEAFTRCLTEKLLTFALGRGLESYDRPSVDRIVNRVAANGYRFSAVIQEIAHSAPFTMRRGVSR